MKRILIILAAVLLLIQLYPLNRSVPEVNPAEDLLSVAPASAEVQRILKSACYDCHSYTTQYPWYSKVAPVSWWLQQHVKEGRKHVNFSRWGSYSPQQRAHAIEEIGEVLAEGEMPLSSYTLIHTDAKLSQSDLNLLQDHFKTLAPRGIHSSLKRDDDDDDDD